jgi:hypothetical protein
MAPRVPLAAPSAFDTSSHAHAVHFHPTDPSKVYNPDSKKYVRVDGEAAAAVFEKYGYPPMQLQQVGAGQDEDILYEQLEKYQGFVNRGSKNLQYELAMDALKNLRTMLSSNAPLKDVVEEFTEVFNMLSEHGFPMGKAQYPGPGEAFKKLVSRVL